MSRLDRFLISDEWEGYFNNVVQSILPMPVSNHFPILLDAGGILRGPSPFRFEIFFLFFLIGKRQYITKQGKDWETLSIQGVYKGTKPINQERAEIKTYYPKKKSKPRPLENTQKNLNNGTPRINN